MRILYLCIVCSIVYSISSKKGASEAFEIGGEKRYWLLKLDHWLSSLACTNQLWLILWSQCSAAYFPPDRRLKKSCFISRVSLNLSSLILWTSLSTIQILKTSRQHFSQKWQLLVLPKSSSPYTSDTNSNVITKSLWHCV